MDDNEIDDDDGWKILTPGVILFETTLGNLDKPIPHPVLDDPTKMMRIIANPLYDKLTLSRAAHIQKRNCVEYVRQASPLYRRREKTMMTPLKSLDSEQTITSPLPNPSEISNSRPQSKHASKRQVAPPFRLPTASSTTSRTSSKNVRFRTTSARSTIQPSLIDNNLNIKKPIVDGTIRYVNSRHGFEVQRYSSHNWLSIDIFCKDACQAQEKTFREMLDKKRQYERLSRSIYSSDYYKKRWHELLLSYKQGYLTHDEWAKQNYQLLCLRTLYGQATKREQRDVDLDAKDVRHGRAQSAYHQWKGTKEEGNLEHRRSQSRTANSRQRATEEMSVLSNNSSSIPSSSTIEENNTTSHRMSISTGADNELQHLSIYQPIILSKERSASSRALYMLDEERWSLQAMLKRVVGLAEPLPAPPKVIKRKQSPMTNTSADSGFESVSYSS